jgi:hypothetical protein
VAEEQDKLLDALQKARAPWWVYTLVALVFTGIALLKARGSAHSVHKRVKVYFKERAVKESKAAKAASDAKRHVDKAAELQEDIDEIDLKIEALKNKSDLARDRIRAATSFSDL